MTIQHVIGLIIGWLIGTVITALFARRYYGPSVRAEELLLSRPTWEEMAAAEPRIEAERAALIERLKLEPCRTCGTRENVSVIPVGGLAKLTPMCKVCADNLMCMTLEEHAKSGLRYPESGTYREKSQPGIWRGFICGRHVAMPEAIFPEVLDFNLGREQKPTCNPQLHSDCDVLGMWCDIGGPGWEMLRCRKCGGVYARSHENPKEEFSDVLGVEVRA